MAVTNTPWDFLKKHTSVREVRDWDTAFLLKCYQGRCQDLRDDQARQPAVIPNHVHWDAFWKLIYLRELRRRGVFP